MPDPTANTALDPRRLRLRAAMVNAETLIGRATAALDRATAALDDALAPYIDEHTPASPHTIAAAERRAA